MKNKLTLPALEIEPYIGPYGPDEGVDQLLALRQSDPYDAEGGDCVLVHRSQIALIAERLGIFPTADPDAQRTITRLTRQLRLLSVRIDRQHDMMLDIAAKGHECVDEELAYAEASYELASEFVSQLADSIEVDSARTPAGDGGSARGQLSLEVAT